MLIWLVGKNGLLGQALLKLLQQKQIAFFASSHEEADIQNLKQLKAFAKGQKITHIINASAYTNVEKAEKEKKKAFAINAEGVLNLVLLAQEKKARLTHVSTDYVFDGKKTSPYLETDLTAPLNVYGASKLAGETLIQKHLTDFLIVRTSWLFGENENNFVFKMLKAMQSKQEIKVVSDQIGRPTFAMDLAQAILKLLPFSGFFHFAGGKAVSWYQFALDIFQEALKQKLPLAVENILPVLSSDFKTEAVRPAYSVLDLGKTLKKLNLKEISYQPALEIMVQFYLKTVTIERLNANCPKEALI